MPTTQAATNNLGVDGCVLNGSLTAAHGSRQNECLPSLRHTTSGQIRTYSARGTIRGLLRSQDENDSEGDMDVLVTGATGFVGPHLLQRLLARGDTIRVLALPETVEQVRYRDRVEVVVGDLADEA